MANSIDDELTKTSQREGGPRPEEDSAYKFCVWKITEIRDLCYHCTDYGYISIRVWDDYKGLGGWRGGETSDVYVTPGAGPYGDQIEEQCHEWHLVRNYWRSIGSPERDCRSRSAPWFPWKAAGFTPKDAGRAWKDTAPQGAVWTASFSPQGAAAAWTASGFNLDELIAAWTVAEFSPVIAIVRWLEQGYTAADICAAWASVGYTFVAVAPGRWGESSLFSTSARAAIEEQHREMES